MNFSGLWLAPNSLTPSVKSRCSLWLAPMAGYTDAAFREMCKARGCDVTVTEMVSAVALLRGNEKSWEMAAIPKSEGTAGVQIFGGKPEEVARACERICERRAKRHGFPSFIDLNFGCPVRRVVEQGAGAALLNDRGKMREIACAAVKASGLPVTAKIRLGWKKDDSLEIAELLGSTGISALIVHGRTVEQGYSGKADWKAIARAAAALPIPVIGNGDARGKEDAEEKAQESGCAGVMLGRAALANPSAFKGREREGWCGLTLEYAKLAEKHKCLSLNSLQLHSSQFVCGEKEAAKIRSSINSAKSIGAVLALAKE